MKFSAIALALSVVLARAVVAAPGDPRLIQGALEWPPALTGAEPFIVVRGDDGRVYYADVRAAQRYVQGALSAGGHIALLGLESTKPQEIIAVALGSGDAAAPVACARPDHTDHLRTLSSSTLDGRSRSALTCASGRACDGGTCAP